MKFSWETWSKLDGWFTLSEGKFLFDLASKIKGGGVILEIGSWKGKSTICLAKGANPEIKICAIDPHVGSEEHQAAVPAGERVWTFDEFKKNLAAFEVESRVTPLVDYSYNIGKTWNQPIELLFIDGAHDEASVAKDFEMFAPHVISGGWIVMHDTTGTWQPGLAGWKGPRVVADRQLFGSEQIGQMYVVDTITAGQRVDKLTPDHRRHKQSLKAKKKRSDLLSIGINLALKLPTPITNTIKRTLGRT